MLKLHETANHTIFVYFLSFTLCTGVRLVRHNKRQKEHNLQWFTGTEESQWTSIGSFPSSYLSEGSSWPRHTSPLQLFPASSWKYQGFPCPSQKRILFNQFWVYFVAFSMLDLLVTPLKERIRRHLYQAPKITSIRLLSLWRSSGFATNSLSKLQTISQRLSPGILQRKPFSATCFCDLILLVWTQSSWL